MDDATELLDALTALELIDRLYHVLAPTLLETIGEAVPSQRHELNTRAAWFRDTMPKITAITDLTNIRRSGLVAQTRVCSPYVLPEIYKSAVYDGIQPLRTVIRRHRHGEGPLTQRSLYNQIDLLIVTLFEMGGVIKAAQLNDKSDAEKCKELTAWASRLASELITALVPELTT
jgi:hypothetical protein